MQQRLALFLLLPAIALAACTSGTPTDTDDTTTNSEATSVEMPTSAGVDMEKSSIAFIGKSNIINHDGVFERFSIILDRDATTPADLTKASVEATIDIASVKTDSSGLDGHFLREDFFDVEHYPSATFRSTAITMDGANVSITGDLTMKGITAPITFSGTIDAEKMVLTGDVPRRDFGIAKDSYANKLLDPMVPVTITVAFEA
jgi:polyisoprenoid-binding protein YceI